MGGIVGPFGVLILIILLISLLITSIYYIIKTEKDPYRIIWILVVLFLPFIGSIIYLASYSIKKNN
jgi:hypothetical protein